MIQNMIGKSGVNNLFDHNSNNYVGGYITNGTGDSDITSYTSATRRVYFVPCKPNTAYVCYRLARSTAERFSFGYINEEENPTIDSLIHGVVGGVRSQVIGNVMPIGIRTGENAHWLAIWIGWEAWVRDPQGVYLCEIEEVS